MKYIHYIIFTIPFYSKKITHDFKSDELIPTKTDLNTCINDAIQKMYDSKKIKGDDIPKESKFCLLNTMTYQNK